MTSSSSEAVSRRTGQEKAASVTDSWKDVVVVPVRGPVPPPTIANAVHIYSGATNELTVAADNANFRGNASVFDNVTVGTYVEMTPRGSMQVPPTATGRWYFDDGTNTNSAKPGIRYYDGSSWQELVSANASFTPVAHHGGALTESQLNGGYNVSNNIVKVWIRFKWSANAGGSTPVTFSNIPYLPTTPENIYIPLWGRADVPIPTVGEYRCRIMSNPSDDEIHLERLDFSSVPYEFINATPDDLNAPSGQLSLSVQIPLV